MTDLTPADVAGAIGSGLLSFPVTHFDERLEFDEAGYRTHIGWLAEHRPAGLFAAGGTGEFFSLTPAEVERIVTVAEDDGAVGGVDSLAHEDQRSSRKST